MTVFHQKNLIGSSLRFRQTCSEIAKLATVDATVMIAGETGTGKELAARAIHYQSNRKNQPFIPVNCGSLPEALIESELFGHERGAFTDAKTSSIGLVSEADGGTLFLDEVDALTHRAQAAMLRFLQDKTYRRLGSTVERRADVRIIVATNANLEQMVEARLFRRDLLYRLNVLMLRMPALRERQGDAVELAQIFLNRLSHQYRQPQRTLHPEAAVFLSNYHWPGNIRELENIIHREFLMTDDSEIRLGEIISPAESTSQHLLYKDAKAHAISQFEKRYLDHLLKKTEGNLSMAARLAGQERSAFGKLVRKHKIKPVASTNVQAAPFTASVAVMEASAHSCALKK